MTNSSLRSSYILFSGIAALGGLLFGYDTAIISGALPFLRQRFALDDYQTGWVAGCTLIGCAVGALAAGRLMDRMGRRWVLFACAVLFAVSGLGAALVGSEAVLVCFRILGGLGIGAAAMVSPVYIAEIAPADRRGRLVSVYQLAIVMGILLAYLANYVLSGLGPANWRWMFGSQTLPAAIFFGLLVRVPETPRWLVSKGRTSDALAVLERSMAPSLASQEIAVIAGSFKVVDIGAPVFRKPFRKILFIGIGLAVFQQITGINAILYYAPAIFRQTGVSTASSFLQTVGLGAINLLVTFLAIGFVDKLGRRLFLLVGSMTMAVTMALIALCFRQHFFGYYLVLVLLLLYVAAFGSTLGAVTWVYLSELFPNRVRAMAISLATLALWLADFVVTLSFPVLNTRLGTAGTLSLYAGCCVLSAVFVYRLVPETKGRSLEEIEQLFIQP